MYYFFFEKETKYIELDSWNFLIIDLEGDAEDAKNLFQCITNSINQLLNDKKQKNLFFNSCRSY